eukprot:23257-Eustigmatos_ZCMA.PRE.1
MHRIILRSPAQQKQSPAKSKPTKRSKVAKESKAAKESQAAGKGPRQGLLLVAPGVKLDTDAPIPFA